MGMPSRFKVPQGNALNTEGASLTHTQKVHQSWWLSGLKEKVSAYIDTLPGKTISRTERSFTCPLSGHKDEHPSARWNFEKGTWYCDVCMKGGGIMSLARLFGILARSEGKRAVRGR